MAEAQTITQPGGFKVRFNLRMMGTPAPVFPGFEIDISTRIDDSEKPDAVWHRERAREMLQAHPEIKPLIGHTPSTALWCLAFVALQVGLAIALAGQPLWLVAIAAYLIGAWADINLFMLAHECNHGLVFGKSPWDRWLYTFTSLPMFMPGHHSWWIEHPVHHNDLGARKDFVKRRRSFFLLTRYKSPLWIPYSLIMLVLQVVRSVIGLTVYLLMLPLGYIRPSPFALSILGDVHLVSGYERNRLSMWAVAFPLLCLGLLLGLYLLFDWQAVVYLLLSQTFMTGFLHPLMFGMILSNSHFHGSKRYQPSSSYYGWLNRITFNFGYHTEHHDLLGVPWSRLPKMKQFAPEFYDPLVQTKSYVGLAWLFLTAPREDFSLCFDNEEHRNAAMIAEKNAEAAAGS